VELRRKILVWRAFYRAQRLDYPRLNLRHRVKIASRKGAILNFAEAPKLMRFKISAARNLTQKHHVLTECRSVLKFNRANFKFSKFRKFQKGLNLADSKRMKF